MFILVAKYRTQKWENKDNSPPHNPTRLKEPLMRLYIYMPHTHFCCYIKCIPI